MQTRWYVPPGQTLKTTKIENRQHELHITKSAWEKLTRQLDKKQAIERKEVRSKAMRKTSENLRSSKEEAHLAKVAKLNEERMLRFHNLRAEQAAIKAKYVEEARKTQYLSRGPPSTLTSVLIGVETLCEREKQMELERVIKQHDYEEEVKYAAKVKQAAIDEKLENEEKARKLCEKKKEIGKMCRRQINKNAELKRITREKTIEDERWDNENADKEMKKIEKIQKEEQAIRRAEIMKDLVDCAKEQKKYKHQKINDEKDKDKIIDILVKNKQKIECLRRKKEREIQMEMQKRRDLVSKIIMADAGTKAATEERIMKAAAEKLEKEEVEKLRIQAENKTKLTKERRENFEDYFRREAKRKAIEAEVRKWELLNRYKANEITIQREKDKNIRDCEKRRAYREMLNKQIENNADCTKCEADEQLEFFNKMLKEEDDQFFKYADEVYDYAVEKGWQTEPIFKAVFTYARTAQVPVNFKGCPKY